MRCDFDNLQKIKHLKKFFVNYLLLISIFFIKNMFQIIVI